MAMSVIVLLDSRGPWVKMVRTVSTCTPLPVWPRATRESS